MKFTPVIGFELQFVRINILIKSIFNYHDDDKQQPQKKETQNQEMVNFMFLCVPDLNKKN